ncbi:hypothetical protein LXA43DRAFT_657772 [Ganoderma leucocontextum]|nr:hypothetical protein LXA43DRAFT_657772 [Ganoderma leucocontextum]
MPRSTSPPPPSYRTTAPYTGYGTLGSPYCNDYPNDPAATETSSLWTGTTYPRRSSRRIPLILCGIVALLFMVVIAQNTGLWSTLADDIPPSEKAAIRRSWRVEKNVWAMEKGQWAVEQAKHQEEVAMWERERKERQEERDAFEREKEEWARQRREEEKHRKEIEWRRRGAYWSEPWPGSSQCHGYGTRPYSANLLNLPGDVNWREACMDMPIRINGQWMDGPDKCEQDKHNTWGTWFVKVGESQCITYWDTVRDMGCSPGQTGMRRYEARLMNLRHGDDWDLMCRTTPATISGVHFDSPTSCEVKNGRTGTWDVPNGWC